MSYLVYDDLSAAYVIWCLSERFQKNVGEGIVVCFKVITQHLSDGSESNHKSSEYPIFGEKIGLGRSRTQNTNGNHSCAMFDLVCHIWNQKATDFIQHRYIN
jgi:hypothetical protein